MAILRTVIKCAALFSFIQDIGCDSLRRFATAADRYIEAIHHSKDLVHTNNQCQKVRRWMWWPHNTSISRMPKSTESLSSKGFLTRFKWFSTYMAQSENQIKAQTKILNYFFRSRSLLRMFGETRAFMCIRYLSFAIEVHCVYINCI